MVSLFLFDVRGFTVHGVVSKESRLGRAELLLLDLLLKYIVFVLKSFFDFLLFIGGLLDDLFCRLYLFDVVLVFLVVFWVFPLPLLSVAVFLGILALVLVTLSVELLLVALVAL